MHPSLNIIRLSSVVACMGLCVAGCGNDEGPSKASGSSSGDPVPPFEPITEPEQPPISAKANVKFKTIKRLVNDLSAALDLPENELCAEFGADACADVHAIALGGTDAYDSGVYSPLESSTATSPIAVDRIVLSACSVRAERDLYATADAVIFRDLPLDGAGLDEVEGELVTAAIATLYQRVLLRSPKEAEVSHLKDLYRDIESGGSATPARDWATLSCFSVSTTMESLFY